MKDADDASTPTREARTPRPIIFNIILVIFRKISPSSTTRTAEDCDI